MASDDLLCTQIGKEFVRRGIRVKAPVDDLAVQNLSPARGADQEDRANFRDFLFYLHRHRNRRQWRQSENIRSGGQQGTTSRSRPASEQSRGCARRLILGLIRLLGVRSVAAVARVIEGFPSMPTCRVCHPYQRLRHRMSHSTIGSDHRSSRSTVSNKAAEGQRFRPPPATARRKTIQGE